MFEGGLVGRGQIRSEHAIQFNRALLFLVKFQKPD